MSPLDRILPQPVRATPRERSFVISDGTSLIADDILHDQVDALAETLAPALRAGAPAKNRITLRLDGDHKERGDEGYRLDVRPEAIDLVARTPRGIAWGVQTLRQLVPPHAAVPCCTIEDQPRFTWRGLMLDCGRHFMPVPFIYKWIDLLALHKMNVFHWHLTEDQGWRIEIKKYPKLTEIGAWRKNTLIGHALPFRDHYEYDDTPHGGFYSQDQIRDIVKYASARGVTIVPEIEMPGHSQAAIAAYPELGNTGKQLEVWNHWGVTPNILNVEESTIRFNQDVLTEVMELFSSTFIHIGGDEAPKDQWKASPRAQARIKELGVRDEHELQSWFIRRMDEFLTSHGRRLVGWDEILEGGLAPGATVMSWRGEEGGIAAARADHDVVMAPQKRVYFDHYQSEEKTREPLAIGGFNPVESVYAYEPVPQSLNDAEARHVLGAQGQLWTEYMPTSSHVEYMAYPRASALAEVLWSPKRPRDFNEFRPRLETHLQRLSAMEVNYRPLER
jgi:hexosaminidase